MPGLDGFGLLRALKEDARTSAVPIILLSARAGEGATIKGMEQGADDYIVKPFSAKDLVTRVAARLTLARARTKELAREKTIREEAVAQREKLHGLFMQAPIAIAILEGPLHTYTFANPTYLALVGNREVLGKPLLVAVPEIQGQGIEELMDRVVSTGLPFIGNEFQINMDRSGTGVPEDVLFNLIYSPKRNARGEIDGLFVCAADVTAQVHARRRVESLLDELKLANDRKDEFLAMLAHELRNPMAAISLALVLLEQSAGDEGRMAKHREMARRQMGHLVRLVDDLLDVARITQGKVTLHTKQVDLASIVHHVIGVTRPAIEARGHELSVTVAPGIFRLEADPTRIEQVLVNLLTNAAKFTEPGGLLALRLTREEKNGVAEAVIVVRDNGRGIPKEMIATVFELFFQVSPSFDRTAGGLGLGLTLVKRLVELHGGTVSARSEGKDQGSEFEVRLPFAPQLPATTSPVDPSASRATLPRRHRILLVEDSADLRESMKEVLESFGHEVAMANDGLEGVSQTLEWRPDVALVDLGLPGIDGYEVARRVRAAPGGESIRLVALTGYGGADAKALALAAGFDEHITKPIDVLALMALLSV